MPNRNVMNQTEILSPSILSSPVAVGARATAAAALSVAVLAAALCTAGPAAAAQSLGSFKDWAAHADGKDAEKVCWIYSEPQKDEGNYTRRGRIYALVTHRPGENTANQVQFTAGYPFKEGSAVEVSIGAKKFELFTNADSAWARSKQDDADIVAAMRKGSTMIVTGESSRGTKTKDTYSLAGTTAALAAIDKACGIK